jgi:hypothetical protein
MLTTGKNPIRTGRLVVQEPAPYKALPGRTMVAIEYTRCPPPDDATVARLNAIAAASPFCRIHKAKRHDSL